MVYKEISQYLQGYLEPIFWQISKYVVDNVTLVTYIRLLSFIRLLRARRQFIWFYWGHNGNSGVFDNSDRTIFSTD